MPVDPADFGDLDFGYQGTVFNPVTDSTVSDPTTDYGYQGTPHPVMVDTPPPSTGGGGVVIFYLSL